MKFHKQLFLHDPANGIFGDCFRTALACLFDLEPAEVPHFCNGRESMDVNDEIAAWLSARGYRLARILYDDSCKPEEALYSFGTNNPGLYYLFSGTSRTGCNHVVIARGCEIVHDPSLVDSGIVGPMSHGYYEVEILTPVNGAMS